MWLVYWAQVCLYIYIYILHQSHHRVLILLIVMGGLLADPAMTLPGLFGDQAAFGFEWLKSYPYALPGILNAIFLATTGVIVFLGLEEVRALDVGYIFMSPPPHIRIRVLTCGFILDSSFSTWPI